MTAKEPKPAKKRPPKWPEVLAEPRGHLWDVVSLRGGVNNLNITNAGYLTGKSPLATEFDAIYNLFGGTAHRLGRSAVKALPTVEDDAKAVLRALGIVSSEMKSWHTYYGQLIDYAWHNDVKTPQGAHFLPIYSLMERIAQGHPDDRRRLDVLRRRFLYGEILHSELDFIDETLDFERIPILLEWTTNKTETFITQAAQTSLLLLEYHLEKAGNPRRLRFEDLFSNLPPSVPFFRSLNTTFETYLLVTLRNEIVHGAGFQLSVAKGSPHLTALLSKDFAQYGDAVPFLRDDILKKGGIGQKVGTETIGGAKFAVYRDPRFSYIEFLLRVNKSGAAVLDQPHVRYSLPLRQFTKMVSGLLFRFGTRLLLPIVPPSP